LSGGASDKTLLVEIKQIYADSPVTYGSPQILADLQDLGIRVGNNRVAKLMREVGIVGRTKRSTECLLETVITINL